MSEPSVFRVYAEDECGPDSYPLAWHKIDGGPGVKHLVRVEAENRCVRCLHPYEPRAGEWSPCDRICTHGAPYRIIVPGMGTMTVDVDEPETSVNQWLSSGLVFARWRILTVHHLRLGQDAKRDLRWWNLAALCQRCHLQIQGKVQMERVWPWPHSEWFKVYAAGWYAWSYLGEDLTRAEVMERLPELLALEAVGA